LMELPSTDLINTKRVANFKQAIIDTLAKEDLKLYQEILEQFQFEHNVPALDVAAALAKLFHGDKPLLLKKETKKERIKKPDRERFENDRPRKKRRTNDERFLSPIETGMERYRIEVGHEHKVKPGNIVGAIANEAEIESKHIGRINIFDEYSVVDLPVGMPKEILQHLRNTYVAGRKIRISLLNDETHNKARGETPKKTSESKPKRKPKRKRIKKES
jgi:ATP-dependent RNA helicase DeaD